MIMWCDFDAYGPRSFLGGFRNVRGVHAMQLIKNFKTRALRFNNFGLILTNIDREIGGQSCGQIYTVGSGVSYRGLFRTVKENATLGCEILAVTRSPCRLAALK